MPTPIRVLCWNIAEGNFKIPDVPVIPNLKLSQIRDAIKSKSPDIVMLNEVLNYDMIGGISGGYLKQTEWFAQQLNMEFCDFGVNTLGLEAHKAVAILSKFPLSNRIEHQVPRIPGQQKDDYGTIECTINVEGTDIKIFSTRFCPIHWVSDSDHSDKQWELAENIEAHNDALRIIQGFSLNVPIIFAGDFNADSGRYQYNNFVALSTLINALSCGVDNIFYRGPFEIKEREANTNVQDLLISDHPYLFVEFMFNPLSKPPRKLPFNPAIHGWKFRNFISTEIAGPFRTFGLCGGMALSAFNYFRYNMPIPGLTEDQIPPFGFADTIGGRMINVPMLNPGFPHPVFDFIYKSQMATFESGNINKQLVLPWDNTDENHYKSSIEEFQQIKTAIDGGKYVIIGLRSPVPGDVLGGHQTLVYGYDTNKNTLYTYDSNHPNIEVEITGDGSMLLFANGDSNFTQYKSYYIQLILDPNIQTGFNTYDITRNQGDNFSVRPTFTDEIGKETLNFSNGGIYAIQSKLSGKFLDIDNSISGGSGLNNGAVLQQWEWTGGDNQKFQIESIGKLTWKITSRFSNKSLDVAYASLDDLGPLQQWDFLNQGNQEFHIIHVNNNYFKIVASHSGKVLDVYNAGLNNGDKIIQFGFHGGDNQLWIFHKLS